MEIAAVPKVLNISVKKLFKHNVIPDNCKIIPIIIPEAVFCCVLKNKNISVYTFKNL